MPRRYAKSGFLVPVFMLKMWLRISSLSAYLKNLRSFDHCLRVSLFCMELKNCMPTLLPFPI